MKIIKQNQLVIFVIALMIITAGYLNYTQTKEQSTSIQTSANGNDIGEATLVSSNSAYVDTKANEILESKPTEETCETVKTEDEYFIASRLERDNMYSQIIESYQKMIEKESVTAEQKAIAQNEITKINNTKNAIMITENLIKTKGIEDVVILVNGENINVIISSADLNQGEVAQIQNIVSREMSAEIENIHISYK